MAVNQTRDSKPASTDQRAVPARRSDPAAHFRSMADEIERWIPGSRTSGGRQRIGDAVAWAPQLETLERDGQLVVQADLPGVKPADVTIEIAENTLTIEGSRRDERQEQHDGYYTTERSYGSFCSVIPLPEGAIANDAKATFTDGVLEVTMPAPPREVSRGRRVPITEGKSESKP